MGTYALTSKFVYYYTSFMYNWAPVCFIAQNVWMWKSKLRCLWTIKLPYILYADIYCNELQQIINSYYVWEMESTSHIEWHEKPCSSGRPWPKTLLHDHKVWWETFIRILVDMDWTVIKSRLHFSIDVCHRPLHLSLSS